MLTGGVLKSCMDITPKKLVCVFAHPDDEAFGPGGSIAHFAARGTDVTIVCVTEGDAFGKNYLIEKRKKELNKSAVILGVKRVINLNFKDGELCNNNYHKVTDELKKIFDDIRPDTIMTFDKSGVSGHLDHVAVSLECSYLFERLKYIKNILYFCNNKKEKKLVGKNYFVYFPEGYDRNDVNLIINVEKYFKLKKSAMMCHKSQIKDAIWLLTFFGKFLKEELFMVSTK